ncbi:N-acetylneuraminate synthase [Magnetospirillum sp. UT-4]|uniref:N-acetylneuraminate synthase n=1 Tax=Magnetospirillum sp. UT-4 TaxID=2681467 RepID=UPI00137F5790|nr:N-acetylneuraminate synthase [Magnetospirillum sp. UT-4]CAA7621689.1 N,N'-diacetyllegionaminic acid synthase [Magnetospirillum sp. UT-4]
MSGVFVIAEAGVNHNGDLDRALALVDAAAAAGADAVKFQTFVPEEVISRFAPKAEYQKRTTGGDDSQLDMVRALRLSEDDHRALVRRCGEKGIAFLSTPFDLPSLDFLTGGLGLDLLKLPSGEITNWPLLLAAARSGRRIILSTGMSTLDEVEAALGVLAFGYAASAAPGAEAFRAAYASAAGRAALAARVSLLHCTTEYPTPFADVNLRAMDTLARAFGLPVGLSDHTVGFAAAVAAVARGATIIEKHFTLDRALPGPDHAASLEPNELAAMVAMVRQVELALGSADKVPAPSEVKNIAIARKSLVARRPIGAGETFTEANLTAKRPGGGVSPTRTWEVLGTPAGRDYAEDEPIDG